MMSNVLTPEPIPGREPTQVPMKSLGLPFNARGRTWQVECPRGGATVDERILELAVDQIRTVMLTVGVPPPVLPDGWKLTAVSTIVETQCGPDNRGDLG